MKYEILMGTLRVYYDFNKCENYLRGFIAIQCKHWIKRSELYDDSSIPGILID